MQKNASPLYLTTFEKVGFALLYKSKNKIPPCAYGLVGMTGRYRRNDLRGSRGALASKKPYLTKSP